MVEGAAVATRALRLALSTAWLASVLAILRLLIASTELGARMELALMALVFVLVVAGGTFASIARGPLKTTRLIGFGALSALNVVLAGWLIARGSAHETGVVLVVAGLIGAGLPLAFAIRRRGRGRVSVRDRLCPNSDMHSHGTRQGTLRGRCASTGPWIE